MPIAFSRKQPDILSHRASKIEPVRNRKLLLHKRQLNKWLGKVQEKGLTIVPVKLYFSGQYVKLDIALAKAKKLHDKKKLKYFRKFIKKNFQYCL